MTHLPVIPHLLIALLLLCLHSSAEATLGQLLSPPSPTNVPRSEASAKRLSSVERLQFVGYKVERTLQESGLLVSEFARSDNIVFAVSWQGPVLPELRSLLGAHFGPFMVTAESALRTRSLGSPMLLKTDVLVIQSQGRMRGFRGYAYLPALVPESVLITDVLR